VVERDVRRTFVLMRRLERNPYIPARLTPHQLALLLAEEREVLLSGPGGSGKTIALLAAALADVDRPGYRALLVQRTLAGPVSLAELARQWLEGTDAHWGLQRPSLAVPVRRQLGLRPRALPLPGRRVPLRRLR